MAKSLRSKWKRKMKAAKRVKYGERERATLVKMLDDAKVAEPLVRLRKTFKTSEPKDEGGHYLLQNNFMFFKMTALFLKINSKIWIIILTSKAD